MKHNIANLVFCHIFNLSTTDQLEAKLKTTKENEKLLNKSPKLM